MPEVRKRPPRKRHGHTQAEQLHHLHRRVKDLEDWKDEATMTIADMNAAIAALNETIANLPVQGPVLVTQAELDAATQGVLDADAALKAKTQPTL